MTRSAALIRDLQEASEETPFTVTGTRRGLELVTEPALDGDDAEDDDYLQVVTYLCAVSLDPRTRTGILTTTCEAEPLRAGDPLLDPEAADVEPFPETPEEWLHEELAARGWRLHGGSTPLPAGGPPAWMTVALLVIGLAMVAGALYLLLWA